MMRGGGTWRANRVLLVALFLLISAFGIYSGSFNHAWTLDDFPVLVENSDIRSFGAFIENSKPGRPLRELTYVLDYALFGLEPAGYHIQNIFWHGLNAFLLFCLLARCRIGWFSCWTAALFFLFHPLNVEVVANISHRKDSLALAFSLLAVLAYSRAFDWKGGAKKLFWVFSAFVLVLVAFFAKQNAIVIPVIFLAYEAAFVQREQRLLFRSPRLIAWGGGLVAVAGMVWFWALGGRENLLYVAKGHLVKMGVLSDPTLWTYSGLVLKSWSFMFLRLFYPVGLGVEYTFPVPATVFDLWVLTALLGVVGIILLLVWSWRQMPHLFFFLAWLVAFWLPTSNLWPLSYFAADRYMYAPSAGFCALIAILLSQLLRKRSLGPLVLGIVIILLILMSFLTFQQNKVWKSSLTLWTQAVKVSPTAAFALNNVGNLYLEKNDVKNALDYYVRANKANPYNMTTHFNLGMTYERLGQTRKALEHYKIFLQVDQPEYRAQAKELRAYLKSRYGLSVLPSKAPVGID